jgi:hypothetical protein
MKLNHLKKHLLKVRMLQGQLIVQAEKLCQAEQQGR